MNIGYLPQPASIRSILAVLLFGGSIAACSLPREASQDVGSMAYPAPLSEGNLMTTFVTRNSTAPDTGNMAYPAPLPQGVIGMTTATRQAFDTGNMAYPSALPQGNGPATVIR